MSLTMLINRPCVIAHRVPSDTTDDYGNEIPGESLTSTVCEIQQRQRSEPADQGETSDTEWVVFLLPAEDLHTGDRVIVDGESYEITGDPWRARNPRTQAESHIEATARRTAGAEDEVGS